MGFRSRHGLAVAAVVASATALTVYVARSQNRTEVVPEPIERHAQPAAPLGLVVNEPQAFQGYTLLAPMKSKTTYLLDMQGRVVRTWESDTTPALGAALLENGHLLRPGLLPGVPFSDGPGAGGRVQEFTWDGKLVWDFTYANDRQLPHHDITRLPNGNVLMIVWEKKSVGEARAAGRRRDLVGPLFVLDCLIEVKPTGKTTGAVVWEWLLWDHLIQDHDETKANYGNVADHPELVDINFSMDPLGTIADTKDGVEKLRSIGYVGMAPPGKTSSLNLVWSHFNSVAYNPQLDHIAISVHGFSEVWIIDHSTTRAEAVGHKGGRSGRGGDLLYRWGNPQAYRAGAKADQRLFAQHDAHWIPSGLPGAGNLLVFNNGPARPDGNYSSVDELVLPVDRQGRYHRSTGSAFGPEQPVWSHRAPRPVDFYSVLLSGAQRLPNGNTLICSGVNGTLFEVTPDHQIVWRFVNPLKDDMALGPSARGQPTGGGSIFSGPAGGAAVFRAHRYAPDYAGIAGRDLTVGGDEGTRR